MNNKVENILISLKQLLKDKFGGSIKDIILFGSYAKNLENKDSDIDILILIDNSLKPSEVRNYLSDFILDILLTEGELISVIVLPIEQYLNMNYPFILNVKREGLRV